MNKVYPIGGYVKIGYSPEHKAREFCFDIAQYMAMWPNAKPRMLVQRKGDISTYIADTQLDGTTITWMISRYDTDKVGSGNMWVAFYNEEDEQLGLTPATTINVEAGPPSINGYIPPETAVPWVQRVLEAADRVEDAMKALEDMSTDSLVVNANTRDEFPEIGNVNAIYKAIDEKKLYQWNEETQDYDMLSGGGSSIPEYDEINGGDANSVTGGAVIMEPTLIFGGNSNGTT